MANEFTRLLRRRIYEPHEISPTVTILRKYRLKIWASTVVLVRHAEKAGGTNAPLSSAGQGRANLLWGVLQDEDVSGVFVTNTARSEQTGQPTATDHDLSPTHYDATDGPALANTIRLHHAGHTVLVVAHSNTIDDIAGALGAPGLGELAETQYDRMFILARNWCGTRLTRLRFGAATP